MKNKTIFGIAALLITLLAVSCTFRPSTPTPIVMPTLAPEITEIFQATSTIPPSITPPAVQTATPEGEQPTAVPEDPTSTPLPTSTDLPVEDGTTARRPGPDVEAVFLATKPVIDGDLDEWNLPIQNITTVTYGAANHTGSSDLSGWFMAGWDEDNLYLAVRVVDDIHVQNATGEDIFKGDSVEFLLDTNLPADFYVAALSPDDYQLGMSPGSTVGQSLEAFLWYPRSAEGSQSQVRMAATTTVDGYQLEAAVPWSLLNLSPEGGERYGFAFSLSDNDDSTRNLQQSLASNVSTRRLTNPRTWGNLSLVGTK